LLFFYFLYLFIFFYFFFIFSVLLLHRIDIFFSFLFSFFPMLWVIIFFFLLFSFSVSMFFFPFPLSQLFLLFGGFPLYAPSCIADFKGAERVFIYLLLPGLVYVLLQVDFLLFYWGPAGQNDGTFWMYHRSSCLCTVHGLGRGGDKGVRGVGAIIMSDHVAIEIDGLLYCASHSPTRPPTRRSGRQVQRPLGALDRSPRSRRTERHGLHRVHTYIGRVKGGESRQGRARTTVRRSAGTQRKRKLSMGRDSVHGRPAAGPRSARDSGGGGTGTAPPHAARYPLRSTKRRRLESPRRRGCDGFRARWPETKRNETNGARMWEHTCNCRQHVHTTYVHTIQYMQCTHPPPPPRSVYVYVYLFIWRDDAKTGGNRMDGPKDFFFFLFFFFFSSRSCDLIILLRPRAA